MNARARSRLAFFAAPLGLALVAAILVMVNYLVARHPHRADFTRSRVFSLSPKAQKVLAGLSGRVEIKLLMAEPGRFSDSIYLEVRELLRRFAARSSKVRIELVDIDTQATRAALLAKQYSVNRVELREGVLIVVAGKRSKIVPTRVLAEYEVSRRGKRLIAFRGEAVLLTALLMATSGKAPQVCFTSGHGEAEIGSYALRGYGYLVDEIRRDGYRVAGLTPRALEAGAKGCQLIVVGGPSRAFAPVERDVLDRHLRGGGRLFLLLGPVLDRGIKRYGAIGLEPLLARWGVELPRNIVIDPVGVPGEQPLLTWATRNGYGRHPISRALSGRLTVWPLSREVRVGKGEISGLSVSRLVSTSDKGWAESDLASLRGDRSLTFDAAVDAKGPVAVAAAVSWRGPRLVVFGSERGVLNRRLGSAAVRDYNRDLFLAALGWLSGERALVAIGPKKPEHLRLTLDEQQLARTFLVAVLALPLLALCTGLLVWWRRRR